MLYTSSPGTCEPQPSQSDMYSTPRCGAGVETSTRSVGLSMQEPENPKVGRYGKIRRKTWRGLADHCYCAKASATYRGAQTAWARRLSSGPSASSRPICQDTKKLWFHLLLSQDCLHAQPSLRYSRDNRNSSSAFSTSGAWSGKECNILTPSRPLLFCLPCAGERKHWAASCQCLFWAKIGSAEPRTGSPAR